MHYHFEHPEFFDGIERTDFRKLSGNLVIYGAGFQGLLAAQLLEEQGIKVKCFVDQDKKKQGAIYHNLPVISPEEMMANYPDVVPIVTPYSLKSAFEYVRDTLGYKNALTPYSLFLDFDSEEFDKLEELPKWYHKEALDRQMWFFLFHCINVVTNKSAYGINYSLTEVCNLRCKNCNALMPNYKHPRHSSYESVINDFNILLKDRIFSEISIEGGESFLWQSLPRLLQELSSRENLLRIYVYTNGTIIPSNDVLDILSNDKIYVVISDYGSISKAKDLSVIFEKKHIKYVVFIQKWYELACYSKNAFPKEYYQRVISDCCKAGGMGESYVSDGKLYRCPEQANLHKLGIFPSKENEYVDLRNNDPNLQKKIEEFINPKELKIIPSLCFHCNGRGYTGKEVPPAEQLKPGEKIEVRFV